MASLTEMDPLFNTLLKQGKSFLNIQKDYKYMVDPHLKLIEQTTSPKLGSIIENFSQNSSPPPQNIVTKLNLVAAEVQPVFDDNANTTNLQNFTSLINNYNAAYLAYAKIAATSPSALVASAAPYRNSMIGYMVTLNNMIKKQLSGRTEGTLEGRPGFPSSALKYDYQAGSGEAGAGDQPQLMAMRAKILGPLQTNLSAQRAQYDSHVKRINTLIGEGADTTIRSKAAYYKYIVWTIVSITLLSYTVKYAADFRVDLFPPGFFS